LGKRFDAEVLKLVPEFGVVDGYFYEKPFGHILCGFLCDRPPSGPYICKYAFPLYDRFRFMHLGFGGRLPGADGHMNRSRPKEEAANFVRRIEPYRSEVSSLRNLDRFACYLESNYVSRGITTKNHHHQRCYTVTLLMLGRADEAARELELLLSMERIARDDVATKDLRKLQADLSQSVEVAKGTLEAWDLETKRQLGLIED